MKAISRKKQEDHKQGNISFLIFVHHGPEAKMKKNQLAVTVN
jgi:hypothetical protein